MRSEPVPASRRRRRSHARLPLGLLAIFVIGLIVALVVASPSFRSRDGFSDIPEGHPYQAGILDLSDRSIIDGYDDGSFRPDDPVIRQQFAKMIVKALDYPVSAGDLCPFGDVPKSVPGSYLDPSDRDYPDHYVAVCAAHGITVGTTSNTFAPYDSITHQQLITMLVRAVALADPPSDYTPPFSEDDFYPREHYLNARRAAHVGLLAGLQGMGPTYDFQADSTRGECAQILYNLLVWLEHGATELAFQL